MNTTTNDVPTDEQLQRYLDGELGEEQYAWVREQLDQHPDARTRFDEFRQLNELVAGYNRSVLSEPLPERLKQRVGRRFHLDMYRIAASALVLGIGMLIGWGLTDNYEPARTNPLIERAVAAHDLYAQEVLHAVEIGGDRKEHLGKWLSKRLGVQVPIPDLSQFDYALLGGRLLPGDERGAHGMLVYEKSDGSRVSVYIMRSGRAEHTNTLYTREADMDVFYWLDVELSCAVVAGPRGSADLETLRKLSDVVYEQIEL